MPSFSKEMEERVLALNIPHEIKSLVSRLFFGVEGVEWLDKDQLYIPILSIIMSDSSFDQDIMERLFSLKYPIISLNLNGVDLSISKGKRGALFVTVDQNHLKKFRKFIETALNSIPIQILRGNSNIPIGHFQHASDSSLAVWMQSNHPFSSSNFTPSELVLLKPISGTKSLGFILKGKVDLKIES